MLPVIFNTSPKRDEIWGQVFSSLGGDIAEMIKNKREAQSNLAGTTAFVGEERAKKLAQIKNPQERAAYAKVAANEYSAEQKLAKATKEEQNLARIENAGRNIGTKQIPSPELPQQSETKPLEQVAQNKPLEQVEENKPKTDLSKSYQELRADTPTKQEYLAPFEEALNNGEITAEQYNKKKKEWDEDQKGWNDDTKKYYEEMVANHKDYTKEKKLTDRLVNMVTKEGGLPIASVYEALEELDSIPLTGLIAAATGAGGTIGAGIGARIAQTGGVTGTLALLGAGGAGSAIGAAIGATVGSLGKVGVKLAKFIQKNVTSPNTEEYKSLTKEFIAGAQKIFGGRVTDTDLKLFMDMLPTLATTDAGKLSMLAKFKNFSDAEEARYQAMVNILKEYGPNNRPGNLSMLVEERVAPLLDKLADDFVNGNKNKQAAQPMSDQGPQRQLAPQQGIPQPYNEFLPNGGQPYSQSQGGFSLDSLLFARK